MNVIAEKQVETAVHQSRPLRTEEKKSSFRTILIILAALTLFLVVSGTFYERAFLREANYKPTFTDAGNLSAKMFKLEKGKYLLVVSEVYGRRIEGYYVDLPAQQIGYAEFSADGYKPITESLAMVNRAVFDGFRVVEELDADFQDTSNGIMITFKGPSELAPLLNPEVEQIYKSRLICNKTILLKH